MRNLNESHESTRQNGQNVKKSQKHDTNLQKNSTLYFQIGLIVCLLAAFGLLEMKFEAEVYNEPEIIVDDDFAMIEAPLFRQNTPEVKKTLPQKQSKPSYTFEEVPNDTPELPFDEDVLEKLEEPLLDVNPGDLPDVYEVPDDTPVPFIALQNVPIYPGCEKEKDNEGRKKCMSDKISKLVKRKFDADLGSQLGVEGRQVIHTQFTIDKTGKVVDIKTRGVHPKLEQEANRVIELIPEMIPGKQRDRNVNVIYSLPIHFYVQ